LPSVCVPCNTWMARTTFVLFFCRCSVRSSLRLLYCGWRYWTQKTRNLLFGLLTERHWLLV